MGVCVCEQQCPQIVEGIDIDESSPRVWRISDSGFGSDGLLGVIPACAGSNSHQARPVLRSAGVIPACAGNRLLASTFGCIEV